MIAPHGHKTTSYLSLFRFLTHTLPIFIKESRKVAWFHERPIHSQPGRKGRGIALGLSILDSRSRGVLFNGQVDHMRA